MYNSLYDRPGHRSPTIDAYPIIPTHDAWNHDMREYEIYEPRRWDKGLYKQPRREEVITYRAQEPRETRPKENQRPDVVGAKSLVPKEKLYPALNPWNNRFERRPARGLAVGRRCENNINGLPCWEAVIGMDPHLRSRVDAFLASEHHRLFKNRIPLMSHGMFVLGWDPEAKLTIIITIKDEEACKKLQKTLKRNFVMADFSKFQLVATTIFPRSRVALQRLFDNDTPHNPSRFWSEPPREPPASPMASTDSFMSGDQLQQYHIDVFVSEYLVSPRKLLLPARIRLGRPKSGPQAVLGGLISLHSSGKSYGLTVAHTIAASPVLEDWEYSDIDRSQTKIGRVVLSSRAPMIGGLDWALVEIEADVEVCTLAPYPVQVAGTAKASKNILLKTARGYSDITVGHLHPIPYYIRADGEHGNGFIETCLISLSEEILVGDCGAWVIDAKTQELYGHVVFGHATDTIAYMVSARDVFRQIEDAVSDSVNVFVSGPGYNHQHKLRPPRRISVARDSDRPRVVPSAGRERYGHHRGYPYGDGYPPLRDPSLYAQPPPANDPENNASPNRISKNRSPYFNNPGITSEERAPKYDGHEVIIHGRSPRPYSRLPIPITRPQPKHDDQEYTVEEYVEHGGGYPQPSVTTGEQESNRVHTIIDDKFSDDGNLLNDTPGNHNPKSMPHTVKSAQEIHETMADN